MNHPSIVAHESGLVVRQHSYVLHLLDNRHFDALNQGPVKRDDHGYLVDAGPAAVLFLNGYCLDAPDYMPAGAMRCTGTHTHRPELLRTERGLTLADIHSRETLVIELIAAIRREIRP